MPSFPVSRVRNTVAFSRSAGRVREPVADHLIGGEAARREPSLSPLARLAVQFQVFRGELRSTPDLVFDHAIDLAPKAGAVSQQILDLRARIDNARPPSGSRFRSGGGREFEK